MLSAPDPCGSEAWGPVDRTHLVWIIGDFSIPEGARFLNGTVDGRDNGAE